MKSNSIITDEMLAAYLDGNATAHETTLILRAIETDLIVRETLRVMSELESEEEADVLPMMAMAAKNEVDNLCAIRCIGYALRHFDIDVSDEQIHAEALQSKSLTSQGMPFGLLAEFLHSYGLKTIYLSNCDICVLSQHLSQGAIVVALVDGGELTGDITLEKQEDEIIGYLPDHVVVVDSINPKGVRLRDSYTPQQLDTYPIESFLNAWDDSGRSILVIYNKEIAI